MGDDKGKDIRDVMREEKSRGRKPLDAQTERERRERDAALLKIIERRDREALKEALELYFTPAEVKERLRWYDSIFGD